MKICSVLISHNLSSYKQNKNAEIKTASKKYADPSVVLFVLRWKTGLMDMCEIAQTHYAIQEMMRKDIDFEKK
jgi:hypothetical protein